jgi:hypothetical protein
MIVYSLEIPSQHELPEDGEIEVPKANSTPRDFCLTEEKYYNVFRFSGSVLALVSEGSKS